MLKEAYVSYVDSPIGFIEIQANEKAISRMEFVEEKRYDVRVNPIIEEGIHQLREYFKGGRMEFDLPLEISGTDFQQQVWQELEKIPYGETVSYGDVAKNIQNPHSSRAVGNANNKNKFSIVIPCHRVIGADGKLVGYGSGVWRKKWLLKHEKEVLNKMKAKNNK